MKRFWPFLLLLLPGLALAVVCSPPVGGRLDIRSYGAVNSNVTGNCTISGGSTALHCGAVGDWRNGQHVAIASVGPLNTLTPPTPTVSTIGATGTRSPQSVADGVLNTTTTLTSATAVFTPFDVGRAVSGTNIPALTTIASVESPTSVTMSAAATGTASGVTVTFGGYTLAYKIALLDNNGGISAVGTSASVTNAQRSHTMEPTNANTTEIAWTAPAGTNYSCIYKSTRGGPFVGTYAYAGTGARIFFDFNQDTLRTDTGGTLHTNVNSKCPASPPGAATNGDLLTTIVSGGGTTNLVLADAAGTSGTNKVMTPDNTVAMQAALDAAHAVFGAEVFIPSGNFYIHNTLFLPQGAQIEGAGSGLGLNVYGSKIIGAKGSDIFADAHPPGSGGGPITIEHLQLSGGENQIHDYGLACTPSGIGAGVAGPYCTSTQKVSITDINAGSGYDFILLEDDGAPDNWVLQTGVYQGFNGDVISAQPSVGNAMGFIMRNLYLAGVGDAQYFVQYYSGNLYEDNVNSNVTQEFPFYNWGGGAGLGSVFLNAQGESNGGQQANTVDTTGTIANGSNSLSVVSITQGSHTMVVDDQITVTGAGANGIDMGTLAIPVYACAISGTTITLTLDKHAVDAGCGNVANAATASCASGGCKVTNDRYSAYVFAPGGPAAGAQTFIGGQLGGQVEKYAIDASGSGSMQVYNVGGNFYDPTQIISGNNSGHIIRPAAVLGPGNLLSFDQNQSVVPSAPGGDLTLSMIGGAGSGVSTPFGGLKIQKFHSSIVQWEADATGVTYTHAPISALAGTVSGTLRYSMPQQGVSFKQFHANFVAYKSTVLTITYATLGVAFANAPAVSPSCPAGTTSTATVLTLPDTSAAAVTGQCDITGE